VAVNPWSSDRAKRAVSQLIADMLAPFGYAIVYECVVADVDASAQTVGVTPATGAARLALGAYVPGVPIRPGIPGAVVVPVVGSACGVTFQDASPGLPVAIRFDATTSSGSSTTAGAVARVGDLVAIGTTVLASPGGAPALTATGGAVWYPPGTPDATITAAVAAAVAGTVPFAVPYALAVSGAVTGAVLTGSNHVRLGAP